MKKLVHIGIILCSAAIAVFFWLMAGSNFTKMQTDLEPLGSDESFADAEGQYISYEAAYPVASWVEEYYSGDPDRALYTGYVIYDVSRDTFLCIIIPEDKDPGFESLFWNMRHDAEVRAGEDMSPIAVNGSLERATPEQARQAENALGESRILEQYTSFMGDESYMKAYFGNDEYGKTLGSMCQKLLDGKSQTEWFVLKQGSINNMGTGQIWLCITTACFNVLIFLFSLISLFRGGKTETAQTSASSGSMEDRFFAAQRIQSEEWYAFSLKRAQRNAILGIVITLAIFIAISFLAKSTDRLMTMYIPLGLLIGEIVALMFWWSQAGLCRPEKIMKRMKKCLEKELPDTSARSAFMEEYVNTEQKWAFREKTIEGMQWGKAGEQYLSSFLWNGGVTVINMAQLDEIETETRNGTVESGKVKVHYVSYEARFFYRNDRSRRKPDKFIIFNLEDSMGFLLTLVRKRVGDNVTIINK